MNTTEHSTTPANASDNADDITPDIAPGQAEPTLEPYWIERRRYLARVRKIPDLKGRYVRALAIYLLRRVLWSFGFFPIFLCIWLPLVFSSFNLVVLVNQLLPHMESFIASNPEIQAHVLNMLLTAWISIGFLFAVFDLVLTPFKSPFEYEADVHMRAWSQRRAAMTGNIGDQEANKV